MSPNWVSACRSWPPRQSNESSPIRDDVDVASLPPYQRQASKALFSDKILLSMTHGEVMSTNFQQALYDAVASFASSKNADGFIDTLQSSIEVPHVGP